jgi:hypothetical protein
LFLDNNLPAQIGGGDAQVWSAQLRARISNRWSVIAPRLGYLKVNDGASGGSPGGFLSAPIGLKLNLISDWERQRIVSAGTSYFIPGSERALSNFGDGDFHFYLTAGTQVLESGHWLSATGFRIPADNNWGTQLWYWSNQWDHQLGDHWYAVFGVNWFHWLRSSDNNFTGEITSIDIINLPAGDVAGNDVASAIVGTAWKPRRNLEAGFGFEFPMSQRTDILENRLHGSVTVRY